MANKFVAVFVMCIVVLAAVHVKEAHAAIGDVFKECHPGCQKECLASGSGETLCEMKCDTDCGAKEVAAKMEEFKNKVKN